MLTVLQVDIAECLIEDHLTYLPLFSVHELLRSISHVSGPRPLVELQVNVCLLGAHFCHW